MDVASETVSTTPQVDGNPWSEVKSKKKKGVRASSPAMLPTPRAAGRLIPQEREPRQKRKPPRCVVVALKIENGTTTYADILKCARQKINIKELGISDPRVRRSANGGILFEISGPDGGSRADALAGRLRSELGGMVRVTRPTKL